MRETKIFSLPKNSRNASIPARIKSKMISAAKTLAGKGNVSPVNKYATLKVTHVVPNYLK